MTIKGLSDYLHKNKLPIVGRRTNDREGEPYSLSKLKGKRVSIETAGIVYKQNWAAINRAIKEHRFVYSDEMGWSQPSLDDILKHFYVYFKGFVKRLVASGIRPVFVVEGKSPDMKVDTVNGRVKLKVDNEKEVQMLRRCRDFVAFRKKLPHGYSPNQHHTQVVIDILTEMKLPTLRAHYEAEGVCGHLVTDTNDPFHCDIAMSDDYDVFMYGSKAVIRNLRALPPSNREYEIEGYALADVMDLLGFNPTHDHERFVLFCLLCGSDYTDNVHGIGPGKLRILFHKHNIHTYEEACKVEHKFRQIPYHKALLTIQDNRKYSVVYAGDP